MDVVGFDADLAWGKDTTSGEKVEFPAVPGTAEDFAFSFPAVFADRARHGHARDETPAEFGPFMRALIFEGVKGAVDVKDADGTAIDLDDPAFSRWKLGNGTDREAALGAQDGKTGEGEVLGVGGKRSRMVRSSFFRVEQGFPSQPVVAAVSVAAFASGA